MKTGVSVATPSVPLPQMVFQGESEASLKTVSELGYDGVELFVNSPEEVKLKELSALLEKYNLEAALLPGWRCSIKPTGFSRTGVIGSGFYRLRFVIICTGASLSADVMISPP